MPALLHDYTSVTPRSLQDFCWAQQFQCLPCLPPVMFLRQGGFIPTPLCLKLDRLRWLPSLQVTLLLANSGCVRVLVPEYKSLYQCDQTQLNMTTIR